MGHSVHEQTVDPKSQFMNSALQFSMTSVPTLVHDECISGMLLGFLSTHEFFWFAQTHVVWAAAVLGPVGAAVLEARLVPGSFRSHESAARVVALLGLEQKLAVNDAQVANNIMRLLIQWAIEAEKLGPPLERLLTFIPMPVAAAHLEGDDVFAQCKRALVSSQMSFQEAAKAPRVGMWMACVLEAIEGKDLELALPVWEEDILVSQHQAPAGIYEGVRWLVQLAHYLEDLPRLAVILRGFPIALQAVAEYAKQLEASPSLGCFPHVDRPLRSSNLLRLLNRAGYTQESIST